MAKKEKKTRKKGKKVRKGRKHESIKVSKYYEIRGDSLERKRGFCPRCGPGVWLSKHKERLYCGKCGYTSLGGKRPPAEAEPEKREGEAKGEAEEKAEEAKE